MRNEAPAPDCKASRAEAKHQHGPGGWFWNDRANILPAAEAVAAKIVGSAIVRDLVGIQGDGGKVRQSAPAQNICTGVHRDALRRQDIARKIGGGAQRGGAANVPLQCRVGIAIYHCHRCCATGCERRSDLEHEGRIGIAGGVQRQQSLQLRRAGKDIDPRRQQEDRAA